MACNLKITGDHKDKVTELVVALTAKYPDMTLQEAEVLAKGLISGPSDSIASTEVPQLRYVNAYAVSRNYGGPEEGGWYYDVGAPLASIPVMNDAEEEAAKVKLVGLFGPEYEKQRSRYSAAGGDDLEIYIEDACAAHWPTERPHYE